MGRSRLRCTCNYYRKYFQEEVKMFNAIILGICIYVIVETVQKMFK